MKKLNIVLLFIIGALFWCSCNKSNNNPAFLNYSVPSTYSFTHFNDSNSLKLLAMGDQVVAAINLGNSIPNTVVSAQTLTGMFNNTGGFFKDTAMQLNGSGLKLGDHFAPAAKTDVLNYFDSIGLYSQSTTGAS